MPASDHRLVRRSSMRWHPNVIVNPALTHRYHVGVERGERRGQFRWHHRRSVPRVVERDVRSRPFVRSR